ncbi:hypothetical protein X777_02254 [Ooceraea biroi]|uniref:Uncharacterized protein n=1 Tax=Ooceraea biroi TaxID=2015173 RepID=A0A026WKV6_OOCBI|nr:hypothetical protein X777_02254 [Ooceraea biroi]
MWCLLMLQILIAAVQPNLEARQHLSSVRGEFHASMYLCLISLVHHINNLFDTLL